MLNNFEACLNAFWTFDGAKIDAAPGENFATSYGVTQMSWDHAIDMGIVSGDMNSAPVSDFAKVLKLNYWDANRCDDLPAGVDLMVFNDATLSGVTHAAKLLQRIVGTVQDGEIGDHTVSLVKGYEPGSLVTWIAIADDEFLASLRTAPLYLHGWERREDYMKTLALKMIASAAQTA